LKKLISILAFALIETLCAQEVKVVFSRTTPPFVLSDGSGIVVDVVKEALAYKKHTTKPIFVNIARGIEMFKSGLADANSLVVEGMDMKGYYSSYFMQYHNKAFALKKSALKISKIEDLKNYHIIAFQNADVYLGDRFRNTAKNAGNKYSEQADQKIQAHMLYEGRTQVAVMDENIFKFYTEMLISEKKIAPNIEVVQYDFFPPTKYQVAFRDKEIRDDFNEGLKHIQKNGRYNKIYQEYGKKYFEVKK